jgi:GMP synthase-like glutamine amidotransferase
VLETGAPPAALEPRFGSYPGMFRALLGGEHDWRTYDVRSGQWPDQPEDQWGYIITGSAAGVYDGEAWIEQLMAFLRAARGRTKLVGICFGHQAMAQAFGGQVIKSPKGWGIGLHGYEVRERELWMDQAPAFAAPASHQDQVVEAPPGTRVLAGSAFTPFGMLDYGADAISLQLHPEFDPAYAAALIEARRGARFPAEQADAALASLQAPNDRGRLASWIEAFLKT